MDQRRRGLRVWMQGEIPMVADHNREVIRQLNMVDLNQKDADGVELPSRSLHVIGPDKTIKLSFLYPAATGRNVDEVARAVEFLQKTANFKVATPVNWKPGEPVVISPSVSSEEAKVMFSQGYNTVDLPSKQQYLRFANL
ncbi:hypothetical protein MUK42_33060 [Musa troglodytarum]|uniref:thioredoxin-dependent peroxiredoxin n=1 Tax=Musa troglodytarum TaxID=320322 RepID=A0A9E7JLD7_9LILI|nr:hypothetical protein MUK42_33060 [Musa troglodytarum]